MEFKLDTVKLSERTFALLIVVVGGVMIVGMKTGYTLKIQDKTTIVKPDESTRTSKHVTNSPISDGGIVEILQLADSATTKTIDKYRELMKLKKDTKAIEHDIITLAIIRNSELRVANDECKNQKISTKNLSQLKIRINEILTKY